MHATDAAHQGYLATLAARLAQAAHGEKGALVAQAAQFLGVSRDWVYAELKKIGWASGRKRRADRGASRLAEDEARVVANLMAESARANGKRLLSTATALEIARENGLVRADVSPHTALRVMRQNGFHPDQLAQPTPHTALRSLHPNHLWQFDVSVCVLFYLDGGGLAVMDEKHFYKNKPANVARIAKQRVLRYLATDHYTGAFYLKYYLGTGETQEILFNFLVEAFSARPHPQDPFHGVPFMLVWDAGSANQSHLIKNFLDRLRVRHWAHEPGRPRAKGQVETTHNLVERDFEGRLYLMQIRDIEHLNEQAQIWLRHYNANRVHSRTKTTRYGLWQTIRPEQLRLCPPRALCEQLLRTKPEARQVKGNLVISYAIKGDAPRLYSVAHVPGVRVGETVEVCVNPYRAPNIDVVLHEADGTETVYECTPLEQDAAGFLVDAPVYGESYKATRDTDTDRHRKAMAKEAYGAETQQEVDQARAKRRPAFGGQIDPVSYLEAQTAAFYMARRGTELDLPHRTQFELTPLSHVEACKRLVGTLGRRLTPEENALVRTLYPQGVPEDQFDALLQRIRHPQPQSLALVT